MKNGTKEIPDGGSCNANIVPNETFYLTAEPKPSDVDERDVVWSAESENVATVSATGTVKGKAIGTTKITARIGNASTSCVINVVNPITCEPGQYLPKGTAGCTKCLADHYCEGGTFPILPDEDKGIKPCEKGYTSEVGATKCVAKTIEVTFHRNDSASDTSTVTQSFTYGEKGNRFGYNTDGKPTWEQTGQFGKWDKANYTLKGWDKTQSASSATWEPYSNVSDDWINENYPRIDLYAVWKKVTASYSGTPSSSTSSSTGVVSSGGNGSSSAGAVYTVKVRDKDGKETIIGRGSTPEAALNNSMSAGATTGTNGETYSMYTPSGSSYGSVSFTATSSALKGSVWNGKAGSNSELIKVEYSGKTNVDKSTGKVTVTAPKVSSSGGGGGSAHYANPTNSSSYHGVTYHAGTSSDPYRYHNNCGCYF